MVNDRLSAATPIDAAAIIWVFTNKRAAQQQFLKRINWNFMKYGSICESVTVMNYVKFGRRAV